MDFILVGSNLMDLLKIVAVKPVGKPINERLEEDLKSGKAKPYKMMKNHRGLDQFVHFLARTSIGAGSIKNPVLKAYFEYVRANAIIFSPSEPVKVVKSEGASNNT
jgi:hypothetical protein